MEMKFASNGKGNAALTTGIIGTALGALNSTGGMLGGLFGGVNNMNCCSSEDHLVNRYEAAQQSEIERLRTEVALRDANTYSDGKLLELYRYFDGELKGVRDTLCAQAVLNQRTEDSFALARQDIASVESRLNEKIKIESERRCCGDNSIITYANATFYPKLVADVTAGTTTTAQTLYNPLPNCGCNCNC